jgi:nicotinamidase-related amidase
MNPGAADGAIASAAKAAEFARKQKYHLIHVGLGFAPGHPEVPDTQPRFKQIKDAGMFVKGTPSAEFHADIVKPGELVIHKQRISAFSDTTLDMVLRANGIKHLVFFGVATSGITLSTLRRAFDLDYLCTVLKDACYDKDAEVHKVLTEKVFAAQARVLTVEEFIAQESA